LAFRREALDKAGFFDEHMSALEDWEWLIRLSRVGPFSHIPAATAEYIVRQGVKSRNILASSEIASLYSQIYSTHARHASDQVKSSQKQYYSIMTGRELDIVEVEKTEESKKPNGRAVETLQLLLDSDDLVEALSKYQDRLDDDLLKLVQENAVTARLDGNLELAEGLSDLAEYISSLV
jgi:hypothetical protein